MTMTNEIQDFPQSVNEDEVAETTEQDQTENSPKTEEKDYRELYENQKIRAEKAEAQLKKATPEAEKETPQEQPTEPSQSNDLDYGQLAFYNTKSEVTKIESDADVEYLKETMDKTGKSQQELLSANWFQSDLREHVAARQTADASIKSNNRAGEVSNNDADIAMAKFKETGELPSDFKTRSEIVKKAVSQQKEATMDFDGPSVIGNIPQQF